MQCRVGGNEGFMWLICFVIRWRAGAVVMFIMLCSSNRRVRLEVEPQGLVEEPMGLARGVGGLVLSSCSSCRRAHHVCCAVLTLCLRRGGQEGRCAGAGRGSERTLCQFPHQAAAPHFISKSWGFVYA